MARRERRRGGRDQIGDVETSNTGAVLDGDLDRFLAADND
jgi:hypothetical protein